MLPVHLIAENLDDAWHQSLYLCLKYGYEYPVEHGSYEGQFRYEFDFYTVRVKKPGAKGYLVPLMPEGSSFNPPTSVEYVENYLAEFLLADFKTDKEDYRYGERLVNAKHRPLCRPNLSKPHIITGKPIILGQDDINVDREYIVRAYMPKIPINQINEVIRIFSEKGSNTNQATTEIAMPSDILLYDPPCIRLLDWRVREGKLHVFVYIRSWDLYAGFPANLGGVELLKQFIIQSIRDYSNTKLPKLENGEIYAMSKGLHVYEQYLEIVEARQRRTRQELRIEGLREIQESGAQMICVGG